VRPITVIFAAGNRQGDRGVTYSMPAPLANRFSHYELDVNLDDWVDWAYKNNILELKRTRHSQSHPNLANLPSAQ
jgi:MoxR-like ATPase